MHDQIADLAERVRAAAAAGLPLRLRGGGSKDFYGQSLQGDILDTRVHAGIVDYDPTELVITARCGTPLVELERTLASSGQSLAFEPPHFAGGATVGGVVAAGLSGPRRQAVGAVRDFVLGARLMDGRGEVLSFGGRVMKNVAGYDVSRLLAGSLGTLGIIVEVSLKTLPVPVAERTLRLELPQPKAIETMNRWGGRPLPISATAWRDGELMVRLSGAAAAVRAATERIGGESLDAQTAATFWCGIRDHTDRWLATTLPLWRLAVPSTTPPIEVAGAQLIEWGGALRWLATQADPKVVRDAAARVGGHATLFRNGDKSVGVFHPLAAPIAAIHRRLKAEFDPARIFNHGRMFADF